MGAPKFTPRPWEVVAANQFGPFCIRMQTPSGSKHPTHYGVGQVGTIENANLIAAAPDLYEALAGLLKANDDVQTALCDGPEVPDPKSLGDAQHRVTEAERVARAAISKAEGK